MGRVSKELRRWFRRRRPRPIPSSSGYEVLSGDLDHTLTRGFRDAQVAQRQYEAFVPLLELLRAGQPRIDFQTLAEAVSMTSLKRPAIVEIGCGSGWNAEVLQRLGGQPFDYTGVDYSEAMIALAQREYPDRTFVVGDATAPPFRDASCDILLSGTVLMHLADYAGAIRESRRLTRSWCIFHTVPVLAERETTLLRKEAYGEPVVEVIFNEAELHGLFTAQGLVVRAELPSIPYDLEPVLGETTANKTYVCEIAS